MESFCHPTGWWETGGGTTPPSPGLYRKIVQFRLSPFFHQIEFWDFAQEVAEMIDVDLSLVIEFCQDAAIFSDTGLELGEAELQDLLGSSARARAPKIRPGGPWIM